MLLTVSDSNDGYGLFEKFAEYLGIEPQNTPTVVYLGAKNDKYKFDDKVISKETLAAFVDRV